MINFVGVFFAELTHFSLHKQLEEHMFPFLLHAQLAQLPILQRHELICTTFLLYRQSFGEEAIDL